MSHLLNQYASNRHLIMPAIGEGMALRLLNRNQLVPIYLSATLATQTLLGKTNQGLLTLSEYAKFLRDMRLTTNLPLIVDLQSGFGNPLNTYYAAQELERSGGDVLLLNDQHYPAHSEDQPATTNLADLLGKLRAAQDATSEGTEIWVKLEGLWEYGPTDILNRMQALTKAGADAIIIDHWQADQLTTIAAQKRTIPLLATWTPNCQMDAQIDAWLDTGLLIREAQRAQQVALAAFMGGIAYAQK